MASLSQAVGSGLSAYGAASAGGTALAAAAGPIGWAVLGLGALGSFMGASSKQRAAQQQMGYISQQQAGLAEAFGQVGEIAAQRTEIAEDIYGEQIEEASYGAGQSLFDITRGEESAYQRSGLARSGGIEQMVGRGREDVYRKFGFQQQTLQNVLGEKLMGIEEYRSGEEARISAEQQRLEYEMRKAREQASTGGFLSSLLGG